MAIMTTGRSCKSLVLALSISGFFAASLSALAQERILEEVLVTAQFRQQSLQDIPLSVSAFSGEMIRDAGVTDFKDLIDLTPGIAGETVDSFFDAISVRGVSNNSFGSGSDPAIGVFLDGVYQSRTGATPTVYDMERVEIIKGPQGTLFGRNTASGAISLHSQKPGDSMAGYLSLELAEFDRTNIAGAVDLPLSQHFRLRVSALHKEENGHIENIAGGRDLGASELDALRIVTVFDGLENTTLTLLAQYEERRRDGTIYRALDTPGDYDQVANDQTGNDESEIADLIFTLEHDMEGMTLTAITGYKTHNFSYIEDFDGTAVTIDTFARDQEGDFFSQELRLTSNASSNLQWVLGASYYRETIDAEFSDNADEDYLCDGVFTDEGVIAETAVIESCDALANIAGPIPALPGSGYGSTAEAMDDLFGTDNFGADPFSYTNSRTLFEQSFTEGDFSGWGIYGTSDWSFSEQTVLTLGLRYTEDKKKFDVNSPVPDSFTATWNNIEIFTDGPIRDRNTWENLSGRIALTHDVTDGLTAYASYTTGYKAGGFDYLRVTTDSDDFVVDATNAVPARFAEESVQSFELGIKSRLLDGRLSLNAALFSYRYDDLQQAFFDGAGGATITDNVGESEGQGLEVDLRWLITDRLDLYFGLSLLDTEFSGAPDDLCEDCDGNEMPLSPAYSGVLMLGYTIPSRIGSFTISGQYTFIDDQYSDVANDRSVAIDRYSVLDVRGSWTSSNEVWRAMVFVENLLDEEYYHWGYSEDLYNLPATQTDPSRPRTLGVRAEYIF